MELLFGLLISVLPSAFGGYYAYVLSKVKDYNVIVLTIAGLLLGPLVPGLLYFTNPRKNTDNSWMPEEPAYTAPALLKDPYSRDKNYNTPGYLYIEDENLIWIPKIGEALVWDYAYAINAGDDRTFKSEGLTWLLLPNPRDENLPYAISTGTKSAIASLGMSALQNVLKSGDQDLFNKILFDIQNRKRWLKRDRDDR